MLFSIAQMCILFAAVFITSYLLTLLVDFESDGRAVSLKRGAAAFLFPFCRLKRYNIASVVLQISNYVFVLLYAVSFLFQQNVSINTQAVFTAAYLALTIIITLITERCVISNNKLKKG